MADKFYVTTPIYYINDTPHLGSAYTTIIADILAIWHRMNKDDVFFLTGLDENSIKTVQAAEKAGMKDVRIYADEMAGKWQSAWKVLNFTNNDFIRTTDERHKKNVLEFFKKVNAKGDIYKGVYEGLYCDQCEEFKLERECPGGMCPTHMKPLKRIKEENYYFKLSNYRDRILKHIKDNPDFIKPASRRNEIISFLNQGLIDTSISRPHLKWGIEFPLDRSHRFWVWFDALINYLMPKGYWPAQLQLMGKDIARFHCITWVGMLMSAEQEIPKTMYAHGFITANGQKMSKSLGNAIDPVALANKYPVDALRYYVIRDISIGEDGNFSEKALQERLNNEIVANYSNLFYRVTSFIEKNFGGMMPEKGEYGPTENALLEKAADAVRTYEHHIRNIELTRALAVTVDLTTEVNKYIQAREPWKAIKTDQKAAATSLNLAANMLRTVTLMYYPFMPNRCGEGLKALGVKPQWWNVDKPIIPAGHKIGPIMLFKKTAEPLTAVQSAAAKTAPQTIAGIAAGGTIAAGEESKREEKGIVKSIPLPPKPEEISKELAEEIEEMEGVEEGVRKGKKTAFSEVFISGGADIPKQITMEKKREETPEDDPADDPPAKKKKAAAKPKKPKAK